MLVVKPFNGDRRTMIRTRTRDQSSLYYSTLSDSSHLPDDDIDPLESKISSSLYYLRFSAKHELGPYRQAIRNYLEKLKKDKLSNSFRWSRVRNVANIKKGSAREERIFAVKIESRVSIEGITGSSSEAVSRFFEADPSEVCFDFNVPSGKKKTECVKIVKTLPDERVIILEKLPPEGSAIYAKNFDRGLKLQQDSIEKLFKMPERHHIPLLLLTSDYERTWLWKGVPDNPIDHWFVLKDGGFQGVEFQRDAVKKSVNSPDISILEGPPGSGKTTVLTEVILQKLSRGERILLVASTHVAVDNVLEKLIHHLDIAVPLRIASGSRELDETISNFTYENLSNTIKSAIINNMQSYRGEMSESQKYWFSMLQRDSPEKILNDIVDDSINLVCGTTIGSMNYRGLSDKAASIPTFDTLIIDEASKTTFPEFLVSAMHCRRWVISGDPLQLSPYVDSDMLEETIQISTRKEIENWLDQLGRPQPGTINEQVNEIERVCSEAFRALDILQSYRKNKSGTNPVVCLDYDTSEPIFPELIEKQFRHIEEDGESSDRVLVNYYPFREEYNDPVVSLLMMQSADLLVMNRNDLTSSVRMLPPGSIVLDPIIKREDVQAYRNTFFEGISGNSFKERKFKRLYDEITWRLKRSHELKKMPDEAEKFKKEIACLLPNFDEELNSRIKEKILDMKKAVLPSIVECLLEGSEPDLNAEKHFLTHGLPPGIREPRHTKLMFQYRMHPDISKYPRTLFYTDDETEESALIDPDNLGADLDKYWHDPLYDSRFEWLDIRGKELGENGKYNIEEIKALFSEVDRFIRWTENNSPPKGEKEWVVAILSFYDVQTSKIKDEFRRRYKGLRERRQDLRFRIGNVDSMQGREADVVYLSLVKTDAVGFLDNPNRINVSITRAKHQVVLIGNKQFFMTRRRRKDLSIVQLSNWIKGRREFRFDDGYTSIDTRIAPIGKFSVKTIEQLRSFEDEYGRINERIDRIYSNKEGREGFEKLNELKVRRKELRNIIKRIKRGKVSEK